MTEQKKIPLDDVDFDLDALERKGAKGPFRVRVGGERVAFSDPQELDWQVLASANQGDPSAFLRAVVAPDDQDAFFGAHVPAWRLEKLMKAYLKHYDLPMPGESPASSGS